MMKQIYKKQITLLSVLVSIFMMVACAESDAIETDEGNKLHFAIEVPAVDIITTRSIDGTGGEAYIKEVDVLIFNTDGTLAARVAIEDANINRNSATTANNYQITFTADLGKATYPNAKTVAVVANAKTQVTAMMNDGGTNNALGKAKATVLNALTHTTTGKWNANNGNASTSGATSGYTPIPMYGEAEITSGGITSDKTITGLELVRMVARVDIGIGSAVTGFTLSNVYVVNYNTTGYIAATTNGTLNAYSSRSGSTEATAMNYTYSSLRDGEIYVYEAAAATGTDGSGGTRKNGICLIVKGEYNGTPYYYRIDFVDSSKAYMNVLRNHLYKFTITAVEGIGYTSFDDALSHYGVINNLKTELLTVDFANPKIVFNGQYYLSFDKDELKVGSPTNSTTTLKVRTNYPGGCTVEVDPGGVSWLTSNKSSITSGTTHTITLTAKSSSSSNRVTYINLVAGRLTYKIKVTQSGTTYYITPVVDTYYKLDNKSHTFTVKSNTSWRIKNITDLPENFDYMTETSGIDKALRIANELVVGKTKGTHNGVNQTNTISFTVNNDTSLEGDVYVVLESVEDVLPDQIVTLHFQGDKWARSNIVWVADASYPDGGYLTFAAARAFHEDDGDLPEISPTVQGVFFQWGSLRAIAPISQKNGVNNYTNDQAGYLLFLEGLREKNGRYTPGLVGGKITGSFVFDPSGAYAPNLNTFYYSSIPEISSQNALGDVCKYVSSVKKWVKGDWRLPTEDECAYLTDGGSFTPRIGTYLKDIKFANDTYSGNYVGSSIEIHTWTNPTSQRAYGFRDLAEEGEYYFLKKGVYIPYSGAWLPGSNGPSIQGLMGCLKLSCIGKRAYFWTSSFGDDRFGTTRMKMFATILDTGMPQNITEYTTSALPVRCVRDRDGD